MSYLAVLSPPIAYSLVESLQRRQQSFAGLGGIDLIKRCLTLAVIFWHCMVHILCHLPGACKVVNSLC